MTVKWDRKIESIVILNEVKDPVRRCTYALPDTKWIPRAALGMTEHQGLKMSFPL